METTEGRHRLKDSRGIYGGGKVSRRVGSVPGLRGIMREMTLPSDYSWQ